MASVRPGQRIFNIPDYGVKTSRRAVVSSGNGLLNNLVAYWPGDEASGNLLDAHTNALHLTDNNTVTNATGKVYSTARQYTGANSEYHAKNDDAYLSVADNDFTMATWLYMDSVGTQTRWIAAKRANPITSGYQLLFFGSDLGGSNRLLWTVFASSTVYGQVQANSYGTPSVSTWFFVVTWHDSVANTINIQINDGVVDSVSYSDGCADDGGVFTVGRLVGNAFYFNGRIGPTAFWKSSAGEGGVLSVEQRTALYNSGAGLAYSALET